MSVYSVSYWTANKSALDAGPAFVVEDTGQALQSALAALALDSRISSIVVSDGPGTKISISVAQISSVAAALAVLKNPDGSTASVIVSDTAAIIGSNFAAIATDSQVSSIQVSNNATVTLTASQVGNNLSAIAKLINANTSAASVIVKDTAANLATYLDRIQTVVGSIGSLVVSNNSQITLIASQVANDAATLNKVRFNNGTTTNLFKVSDTGAHIGVNLDALAANAKITAITISDSAVVQATIAQITSDAAAIVKLVNAAGGGYSLAVADTAANLSAALDGLAGNGHVGAVVVSDSAALTVSVAQTTSDAATLARTTMQGGGAYTLIVADAAANIGAALAALNANSHVANIIVQSGVVALGGVAALTSYATALGKLHQSDGTTQAGVVVTDTAANISAALSQLHGDDRVAGVVVSDSASHQVAFSVAQLTSTASDLPAKIFLADGTTPATFTVADTASHLSFGVLAQIASNAQVGRIVVLSGEVLLTAAQWSADGGALAELYNSDLSQASVWISDAAGAVQGALSSLNAAAQVARIVVASGEVQVDAATAGNAGALAKLYAPSGFLAAVAVSDTAANLSSNLDALNANARIDKLVISDSGALTLLASQVANDAAALSLVQGGYAIAVSDTAANVATSLASLAANGAVASIALTDSGTPSLSVSQPQFAGGLSALQAIAGQFALAVGSVAVSGVAAVETGYANLTNSADIALAIAVVDTGAHLGDAALTLLGGDSYVQSIAVSSGAMSLTKARFSADLGALAKVVGSWALTVSGVAAAEVGGVESDFDNLSGAQGALSISVVDVAANLTGATLLSLGSDARVQAIAVSDTLLTLTASQFLAASAGFSKLSGTWAVAVTGASVSQASAVESAFASLGNAASASLSIRVVDTGAHLTNAALTALGGDASVQSIGLSSGALSLTASQFLNASTQQGLAKIAGSWTLSVSGVWISSVASVETAFHALANAGNGSLTLAVGDAAQAFTGAALATLGQDALVQSIAVTSGTLVLTSAQFLTSADRLALAKIAGAWSVSVTGVAAADVGAVEAAFSNLASAGAGSLAIGVSDIGANLSAGTLATFGLDANIHAIAVASGVLTMLSGDLGSSAILTALGSITNDYSLALTEVGAAEATSLAARAHVVSLAVDDLAANVQAQLDALNANVLINRIAIFDNAALAMSAYASTHDARAIGLLQNADSTPVSLTVSDSGANVTLYFDALSGQANVSSIVIADNTALSLSAAQIGETSTIAKLSNADASGVTINVFDTAANIVSALGVLEASIDNLGYISQITITDNAPITLSLAQRAGAQTAIGLLQNANGNPVPLIVEDTAANVLNNTASLAQDSEVTQVLISDNVPLQLTVAQYQSDLALFSKLGDANASPYGVIVADNAANLSAELDALASDAHVQRIIVSGNGAIGVNVAAIVSDAAALNQTYNASDGGASTYALTVSDTAQALSGAFGALNANSHVASIVVSDSAQHEVRLGAAAAAADASAEDKLHLADGATPAHIAVSDSAALVSSNFDSLNANAHVDAITIADGGAVTLGVAQFLADTTAIGELQGSYQLSISGSGAALGGAALDLLQANGHVGAIVDSDNAAIAVTVAQLTSDAAVLAEVANADQSAPHLVVSDTAAHIEAGLAALNANARIDKIIVTDSATQEVTTGVAGAASAATALGKLYAADGSTAASVAISDSASAISSAFAALDAQGQVNRIVVSDSASQEVTLSAGLAASDSHAQSELYQADGVTPASIAVMDSAAALALAIQALNSDQHLDSITISDPQNALVLSAAQVALDTRALSLIAPAYTIDVVDSSGQIAANLDALEDNNALQSVRVQDNGAIDVTVATFERDQSVIASLIHSDASEALVTVTDTVAAVSADLVNLAGEVSEIAGIVLGDSGTIEVASLAAFSADAPVLARISGSYTLAVADSAAHVTGAALDALQAYAAAGHLASLSVQGGGDIAITSGRIVSDSAVLALTANGDSSPYRLAVTDTAAHISAAFDALAGNGHVDTITISDSANPLTLTASQYALGGGTLGKIVGNYTLALTGASVATARSLAGVGLIATIAIADDAENVVDSLDALNTIASDLSGITLTDAGVPTVALTFSQFGADSAALALINSAFDLSISGVSVADALTLPSQIANPHATLTAMGLSDSSANVQAHFSALTASQGLISSLAFTDGSPTIALSKTQYDAAHALLSAISGSCALAVSGVAAADVAGLSSDSRVSMSVTDTSAGVQANFDALVQGESRVTSLAFTDMAPSLTLSQTQYAGSAALRPQFQGAYALTIIGVAAADAAGVAADSHVAHLAIADTSANIQARLAALQTLAAEITAVSFTDAFPGLSLTATQLSAWASLIGALQGSFALVVTGVAAANAVAIAAGAHVTSVAIVDTSANVQANFAALTGLGAKIGALAFTDGSPALGLTGSQYDASAALRAAFQGAYTLTVTAASAADAASLVVDSHLAQVSILDGAAQLQSVYDVVSANSAKVASIAFTDVSPAVVLTKAQYVASVDLRSKMPNAYTLSLTGLLVADVAGVAPDAHVTHLALADTSSHVQAQWASLAALGARIADVVFTDGAPALTLTETQFNGAASLRATFEGAYALTVTEVTAADAATVGADSHVATLGIADTSAHVQAAYDALTALGTRVASVAFSDGPAALTVTAAQYSASAALRGALQGAYTLAVTGVSAAAAAGIAASSHVATLTIADTAANVQAALDALQGLAGEIGAITLSDTQTPTLTLTAAQFAADGAALQKIASAFNLTVTGVAVSAVAGVVASAPANAHIHTLAVAVTDTGSHIAAALDQLNPAVVQSVTVSDNAALTFGAAAAANGASALGKLANANASALSLRVSDTAAQISANFSALVGIGDLSALTISDNAALSLAGAQVLAGAAALARTADADASAPTINVTDTAAGLAAAGVLDALEAADNIASIVVSGGPLVVTVAQLIADGDVIGAMTNSAQAPLAVTVRDTGNNIAASLGLLALDPQVTAIQLSSGGAIPLTVAQFQAYLPALGELQGATLTIRDTAAALQGVLDQLQGLGAMIGGVVVSNSLPMTLSAAKIVNDAATLAKLSNRNGAPVLYNVLDTGANVAAALPALAANNAHIGAVTLTSGSVSVDAATYLADHAVLDKITAGFLIADAAVSIASLFDAANADHHVNAITLTDGATPVLSLSPSSAAADTISLAEVTNPLFEILTSQGGTYYASGTGPNGAALVVADSGVHAIEKTGTNLSVVGSNDTIAEAANATLAVSGNGMIVTAGANDADTFFAGTGDQFTGSNDSLTIAGDVGLLLSGSANTIAIGAGDTLTLAGPQTLGAAVSGAGALAVSSGVVTLATGTTLAMGSLSESGASTNISALGDLAFAGALTQAASTTLTEASGHTLTLSGSANLSGAVAGAGALAITGGTATVSGTTHLSTASVSLQGASTVLNVAGFNARTGNFSASGGATLNLSGGNLNISGTGNSLSSVQVLGSNTLANFGSLGLYAVTVGGSAILSNNSTVTQSGGSLTLGDSSASTARLSNQVGGVWNIVNNSGVMGVGPSVRFVNSGLLEKTGGTLNSAISASFASTGSIVVNTGVMAFSGSGDTFSSSISGPGGLLFYGGSASISSGTTVSVATFGETGASTSLTLGSVAYAGAFTQGAGATLNVSSAATFGLSGAASLAGTIAGAGALAINGGATTVAATAKLLGGALSAQGSSTVLNFTGANARAGNFSVSGGASVNLSGGNFTLSGAGNTLSNARILGAYAFVNNGTLGVGAATIGGSAVLADSSTLNQSGGTVTLGDGSVSTAKITTSAAAIYDITDNSGIASASTATRFNNAGLFEKTGGTGVSLIAPIFANTGQVRVSSGTLEFAANLTGAGTHTIAGASTLAFDAAVGAGAAIAFTGSGGNLKLASPHGFAGVLSGFDTVGSNDAVTLLGSWSSAGFAENSGHTQGLLQLTSGSQTASLTFTGNYASNFHLAQSSGSTVVTYG